MVELIVAKSLNGVIGMPDGKLPWHLPTELQLFKSITSRRMISIDEPPEMSSIMVMGRKTFESIGKALPNRVTWIMTTDEGLMSDGHRREFIATHELQRGIAHYVSYDHVMEAISIAQHDPARRVIIAGGAQLYDQLIDEVDIMHITTVNTIIQSTSAHAFFDDPTENMYKKDKWELTQTMHQKADELNTHSFTYNKYKRI